MDNNTKVSVPELMLKEDSVQYLAKVMRMEVSIEARGEAPRTLGLLLSTIFKHQVHFLPAITRKTSHPVDYYTNICDRG